MTESVAQTQPILPERREIQRATVEQPNRAKQIERVLRRRARLLGAEGEHTAEEFLALCEKYGNVCLCCKEEKPLTIDHVVPLILGGTNDIENIQPLCRSCNSKKHIKIVDYRLEFTLSE